MDSWMNGDRGDVVGEYVGTITGYQPTAQAATVRLRAAVRTGSFVRISSNGVEWEEQVKPVGKLLRRKVTPPGQDVQIKVHRPVDQGAEVFRLW